MNLKKHYDEYDKLNKGILDSQNAIIDANEKEAIENLNKDYEVLANEAAHQYDADINLVDVQRRINERKVAETMANYGLTDSGLNRTQQTAVRLGADNAMAQLKVARQKQVDALARELQKQIGSVRTNAQADRTNLATAYQQNRNNYATSTYNAEVKAKNDAINQLNKDVINAPTEQAKRTYINSYLTNYPDDAERVMKAYGITKDDNGNFVYNNSITSIVGTSGTTDIPSSEITAFNQMWRDNISDEEKRKNLNNFMSTYGNDNPLFKNPRLQMLEKDALANSSALEDDIASFIGDFGAEPLVNSKEWGNILRYYDINWIDNDSFNLSRKKGVDNGIVKDGVLTYYGDDGKEIVSQVGTDVDEADLKLREPNEVEKGELYNALNEHGVAGYMKVRDDLANGGVSKGKMDKTMAEKYGIAWEVMISTQDNDVSEAIRTAFKNENKSAPSFIYNVTVKDNDDGGGRGWGRINDNATVTMADGSVYSVGDLFDILKEKGIKSKIARDYLAMYGGDR